MATFSVMADVPNPLFDKNGDPFSGSVLKAFLPGTTTSTSIAIDSAGGSPQTSITANAQGKWEVSGNEILPYIDRKHKWAIFANATDAAANTPAYMGFFDNVEQVLSANVSIKNFATVAAMVADTSNAVGDFISIENYTATNTSGVMFGKVVAAGTGTADGGSFIDLPNTTPATQFQQNLPRWISVKLFGAEGDAVTDDFPAAQATTNFVELNPLGGVVFFPNGAYSIAGGTITNDRSSDATLGRVSFVGEDENGTRLNYSGVGPDCILIKNHHTAAPEQNVSRQIISDMTILGPSKRTNSSAITYDLGAFPKFERLNIQGFDFGLFLQDVDHAYFQKVSSRFNNKGIQCRKNPVPLTASTQPNNMTFVSCTFSNNTDFACTIIGGSSLNFFGGSCENNGTVGAGGFGMRFLDCGFEGGKGANLQGVYFEGNNGIADVILEGVTVNATPLLSSTHFIGSDFKRLSNTVKTTNLILCAFGADATVGHQQLVLNGSTFKEFTSGGYVASTATKYIAYSITAANINNFFDSGSSYDNSVETPDFIQNLNKFDLVGTKTADQVFTTGVSAKWLIDTVDSPNPLWSPTITTGDIIIIEDGTYTISIFVILSTSSAGNKELLLFKNGVLIGYEDGTIDTNVASANLTARFLKNDVLTINYLQSTGANQSITGGGVSVSNVTISKVL